LTFAGVSDCKMQEGSMRADINISVREEGTAELGIRTEMKNLNSLKAIKRAIEFESARHIDALETGVEELVQETRRWDDGKNKSYSMRNKEDATDYRYFPNSEIPPVHITKEWVESVRDSMPEPAHEKFARYLNEYGLPEQDCGVLTSSKALADAFDDTMKHCDQAKEAANWILVELINLAKTDGVSVDDVKLEGKKLSKLIGLLDKKTINRTTAKEIFAEIYRNGADPIEYVEKNKLGMVSDEGMIEKAVKEALEQNPKSVQEYKDGSKKVLGFFVGIIMRQTGGKADPAVVNSLLKKFLDNDV